MAMYETRGASALSLEISVGVGRIIAAVVNGIADIRAAHQTRVALSKLTDAQLDDIGLNRADVNGMFVGR